jgi:hypothetical protein
MSQFRLHIDVPIGGDESQAIAAATAIVEMLSNKEKMKSIGVDQVNYRVGHDDDRQKSNYLMKNEAGHINNKKSRIMFTEDLTGAE